MEVFGYLASILMGITLGMTGGGGSILTVPILVYLFKIEPDLATTYSLFIVGLTALVGGFSYFKKGLVNFRAGVLFAVPSIFGVYLSRRYIVPNLPDPLFSISNFVFSKSVLIMTTFSILMVFASLSMIQGNKLTTSTAVESSKINLKSILIQGFLVGAITGFVGAGGGFLITPALVALVGIPMKIAVGTSLYIIAVNSLIGFVSSLQSNLYIKWTFLVQILVVAFVGLFIGIMLSKKMSDQNLKKGLGYFVLVMGSLILLNQFLN